LFIAGGFATQKLRAKLGELQAAYDLLGQKQSRREVAGWRMQLPESDVRESSQRLIVKGQCPIRAATNGYLDSYRNSADRQEVVHNLLSECTVDIIRILLKTDPDQEKAAARPQPCC
jgi:hypothetical protein